MYLPLALCTRSHMDRFDEDGIITWFTPSLPAIIHVIYGVVVNSTF